jgi:hypothetical protein
MPCGGTLSSHGPHPRIAAYVARRRSCTGGYGYWLTGAVYPINQAPRGDLPCAAPRPATAPRDLRNPSRRRLVRWRDGLRMRGMPSSARPARTAARVELGRSRPGPAPRRPAPGHASAATPRARPRQRRDAPRPATPAPRRPAPDRRHSHSHSQPAAPPDSFFANRNPSRSTLRTHRGVSAASPRPSRRRGTRATSTTAAFANRALLSCGGSEHLPAPGERGERAGPHQELHANQ